MTPHLETFAKAMHPGGGWGYAPGLLPQLEPSCLGLLALSLEPDRFSAAIAKTREYIETNANADGSYRPAHGREEAIWPTSLVLFVKAVCTADSKPQAATVDYLLGTRGIVPNHPEAGELHDIDINLIGWPWAEKNFSWVEPTSWACLALKAVGQGNHPRVVEGTKLLLDRAMDTGGINYGNRLILGKMTDPIPSPTAIMLMAVQGVDHPRIGAAVQYLIQQINTDDLEHLCWSKMALDLYRDLPNVAATLTKLDQHILAAHEKRRQTGWLKPNLYRQALMILALDTEKKNFFRVVLSGAFSSPTALPQLCEASGPYVFDLSGSWDR